MNWNELFDNGRDYAWFTTQSLTELLERINYKYDKANKYTALDIGCGTGQLVRDLYHQGINAKGIDTSKSAITIAKQSTLRRGVAFRVHDITTKPLNQTFNLITTKYVMAFIKDKNSFLKNVTRMLKKDSNAYFVLISPNPEYTSKEKLNITINTKETERLLSNYFKQVKTSHVKGDVWFICSN